MVDLAVMKYIYLLLVVLLISCSQVDDSSLVVVGPEDSKDAGIADQSSVVRNEDLEEKQGSELKEAEEIKDLPASDVEEESGSGESEDSKESEDISDEVSNVTKSDVDEDYVEPDATLADPYTDMGCDAVLSVEEFASICGIDPNYLSKTYRSGSKNCIVNIRHTIDRTSTAAITSYLQTSENAASSELDRRLRVRMAGASNSTIKGARTYMFDEIGRHNIEFSKGANLVTVSSSTDLCPEDKLMEIAKIAAKSFS